MSEPEKAVIKTFDGSLTITKRIMNHPKSGDKVFYLSFSNGLDATGVFLSDETESEIIEFLSDEVEEEFEDGIDEE